MNRIAITLGMILLGSALSVHASSFAGSASSASSKGGSATSNSTSGNDKVVREAREDAAGFVASDGRMRSARLEAALRVLREDDPQAQQASDLELARKILALR